MRKLLFAGTAVLGIAFAIPAQAATLIGAAVTGPTGTVWDTTNNSFYTLFLQANNGPGSPVINPTSAQQPISVAVNNSQGFLLNGEGFPASTNDPLNPAPNSDSLYNLTLNFLGGATLTGAYTPLGNIFSGGTSAVIDGSLFTLSDFSWTRDRGDSVQAFTATPGGDPNDYHGNFQLTQSAPPVPEPGTWAMMLLGFGTIGVAMRRKQALGGIPRVRYA